MRRQLFGVYARREMRDHARPILASDRRGCVGLAFG
jgi:hypothetical protein